MLVNEACCFVRQADERESNGEMVFNSIIKRTSAYYMDQNLI